MRANQIQASVPAPVASLPPREPMSTVHFSMARSVHFSMAIDTRRRDSAAAPFSAPPRQRRRPTGRPHITPLASCRHSLAHPPNPRGYRWRDTDAPGPPPWPGMTLRTGQLGTQGGTLTGTPART